MITKIVSGGQTGADRRILDVRTPEEWAGGHVPGPTHFFLADLRERTPELNPKQPVGVDCGTGYRARIVASMLQADGFDDAREFPGSWTAWYACGYPIAKNGENA